MTFWHADEAWLIASQTRVAAHLPGCTLFHALQVLPSEEGRMGAVRTSRDGSGRHDFMHSPEAQDADVTQKLHIPIGIRQ